MTFPKHSSLYTALAQSMRIRVALGLRPFLDIYFNISLLFTLHSRPQIVDSYINVCDWLAFPLVAPHGIFFADNHPDQDEIMGWHSEFKFTFDSAS